MACHLPAPPNILKQVNNSKVRYIIFNIWKHQHSDMFSLERLESCETHMGCWQECDCARFFMPFKRFPNSLSSSWVLIFLNFSPYFHSYSINDLRILSWKPTKIRWYVNFIWKYWRLNIIIVKRESLVGYLLNWAVVFYW